MRWRHLFFLCLAAASLAAKARADITNGLIAYLPMDETNGLTAFDSSAHGHNAALINFPAGNGQWIAGRTNGALNLNAVTNTQRGSMNDISGALNFGALTNPAFSLAVWVRGNPGAQSAGSGIISKGYGHGGEQFALDVYAGAFRFYVRNAAGTSILIAPGIAVDTTWQHLVGTCDCAHTNNGLKFYINGQLIASTNSPATLLSNLHEVSLGSREDTATSGYILPFFGALDDVHIYNRTLSASDVTELYNVAGAIPPVPDAEFDAVRLRWLATLNGGGTLNTNDPATLASLGVLSASAQSVWSSMNLAPARSWLWSDLSALPSDSTDIWYTYQRLRTMALAYATPGTALYTNSTLRLNLTNGLDWMYTNVYNPGKTQFDNWWHWQIGTPLWLNDITVLLYDTLSGAQITNYMNAINAFTPAPSGTAANLIWEAAVVGVRGAIIRDSSKLNAAISSFSSVFPYVTGGDGFYADGSFIQHGAYAYTGSYGSSLLLYLSPMIYAVNGSRWAVSDPKMTNVYQWVYNSFQPVIYSGAMMSMVRGRAMSRQDETDQIIGQKTVAAILRLAQSAPSADAATLNAMVKEWIQTDTASNFLAATDLGTLPVAENILTDPGVVARGPLLGHYNFASMGRAVHWRSNFTFGVSMSSSRIANYESINSENFHGWYTGEGMTYLYDSDQTQFDDNFWPTVNPYRLPGTTVDTQARANSSDAGATSTNNCVGGASLNGFGSAAMQLKAWNSDLTAKKSWFMFNDEIVCLGAGITSTSNRVIESIVENRKLTSAGTNTFIVNGTNLSTALGWSAVLPNTTWAFMAGNIPGADIGYYFPQPATLNGQRQSSSGSWYDINTTEYVDTSTYTRNYLTLWFNHGVNPVNNSYSYVLLPGKSAADTAAYAANPALFVLQNSSAVQAVTQVPLGITAVNFWNDGAQTSGAITVNHKAAVLLQRTETNLAVAVSDLTQTNTAGIIVTVNYPAGTLLSLDPGITVQQTNPLQLSINTTGSAGKSYQANFSNTVTNFAGFQSVHFSAAQLADPSISGPAADPDHDGVNNLMEYALMLDPWQAGVPPMQSAIINQHFTLTYTRRKMAADLTFAVAVSGDLKSWDASENGLSESILSETATAQTIQVTDSTPINPNAPRYYSLWISF